MLRFRRNFLLRLVARDVSSDNLLRNLRIVRNLRELSREVCSEQRWTFTEFMPLGILVERVMIEESVVEARQGMIFMETERCVGSFSSQIMPANFVCIFMCRRIF